MTSWDGRRGASHYDSLDDAAQAEVRAEWADRIDARRAALDLGAQFEAAGRPFAVLGEDGVVVIRNAG
jgi:hypothetical protein